MNLFRTGSRTRIALLLSSATLAAAVSHPKAAATIASYVTFEDLTDADLLTPVLRKSARVEGRLVYYPAPTKEAEAELGRRTGNPSDPSAQIALRHLAEAKRQLGDMEGARKALSQWAENGGTESAERWYEAAGWGAEYNDFSFAFQAAAKALSTKGLSQANRRSLATRRTGWALTHPDAADPLRMLGERASLFPRDPTYADEWIQALIQAGKTKEAEEALKKADSFPEARRVQIIAFLKTKQGDKASAQKVLEEYLSDPRKKTTRDIQRDFATATASEAPSKPDLWRTELDKKFDARPLVLLFNFFQGKSRGDLARQVLAQVELRHESQFNRDAALLMSRLWEAIDAIPEAFRSRIAAARQGGPSEKLEDLAALSGLALKAGSRPLAWGVYNDEAYRWAARIDVTPGFFTGGLSLLLTGFDGKEALAELEAKRLPERTFQTAKVLAAELEKRSPNHPALPKIWLGIMERHTQRGEGAEAMALLAKADKGSDADKAEARRIALMAIRQSKDSIEKEAALWRERLRFLSPDGSNPEFSGPRNENESDEFEDSEKEGSEGSSTTVPSLASSSRPSGSAYASVLREGLERLSSRDRSNRTSLSLLLGELDRMPKAEGFWIFGSNKIEEWNLDSDLESRYRAALSSFQGQEWWKRLFRWYAKYRRAAEQRSLADDAVSRFRSSEIFKRDPGNGVGAIQLEGQPNPYVYISDYIRLKALERFPASPAVLREAENRLVSRSAYQHSTENDRKNWTGKVVVEDALLTARRDAVLFVDDQRRGVFINNLMQEKRLETFLNALESQPEKTPVEMKFLLDGWTRLSKFEHSVAFADQLADLYPGNGAFASEAITLHRSLSGITPAEATKVFPIVFRAASAHEGSGALWTNAGEMWQDLDRPLQAKEAFQKILDANPRNPETILEVSTIYWDYGRIDEALQTLEEGRRLINRPRMHAFEAGVLREEKKDIDGAITEYLNAVEGERPQDQSGWYAQDYKAQQRLAQLLGRKKVQTVLEQRIGALKPGSTPDEKKLLPLIHLLSSTPQETNNWDDWIDMPHDPVGREQRAQKRQEQQPGQEQGINRTGGLLTAKSLEMIKGTTNLDFVRTVRSHRSGLLDPRWNSDPQRAVELDILFMEREAALMPTEEEKIDKEIGRVRYLVSHGRLEQARQAAEKVQTRVQSLADGALKMRSLGTLARLAEQTGGNPADELKKLSDRYPWSLGVLDDRLEFCFRTGREAEGLDLLEKTAGTAAEGHKQKLTERLVRESLDRRDVPRGKRALKSLLALQLEPPLRISAAALMARISFREDSTFRPIDFAKAEAGKMPEDVRPDLWAALARAARMEGKGKESVDLWIEAINRRTAREWLTEGSQTATQFHLDPLLLKFFEDQRARSPRDVRWAVAVRELKAQSGDLAGAIVAAKEACGIVPEREMYWSEAVTLFERAGQYLEAAAFLDGWASARRGDEKTATWRAALLVKGGQVQKAIDLERATLSAFQKEAATNRDSADVQSEVAERTARIARRFLALNRPKAAWAFAVPEGKIARASEVPLSNPERTEIAIRSGNLMPFFRAFESQPDFLTESADPIQRLARAEDLSALQEQLLSKIFPPNALPNEAALRKYYKFAGEAGLHGFDEALSRGVLAFRPGIFPRDPPVAFLKAVSPVTGDPLRFTGTGYEAAWVSYLVKSDEVALLTPIVLPRTEELDAVIARADVSPVKELAFASWLSAEAVTLVAAQPEQTLLRSRLASWLKTPQAWDRLQRAMGGRLHWNSFLPLVDEETQKAWVLWAGSHQPATDPVLARRRDVEIRTGASLSALLEGKPNASQNPDIIRLRGPRTVGDVLGSSAAWLWPDFTPRPSDQGEDTIFGTGVDQGRIPGRLWGARPGEAWFVLEAICRWRERDAMAPYVSLEAAPRGGESDRTLLAVRTAEGLGNLPLALSLDETFFGDLYNADRLRRRLSLLVKAGGPDGKTRAEALFRSEVRKWQEKAPDALFLEWKRIASDYGLTPPGQVLATDKPVSSSLLAYLYDSGGPSNYRGFKPVNLTDFRASLAFRWSRAQGHLTKEEFEEYLTSLWIPGAASFPARAAARLEGMSPEAISFLGGADITLRKDALEVVRALPNTKPLSDFVSRNNDRREVSQLLLLRAELTAGATDAAMARIRKITDEGPGSNLTFVAAVIVTETESEEGDDPGESRAAPAEDEAAQSTNLRLQSILKMVRSSKNQAVITQTESLFRDIVRKRLESGWVSPETWAFSIDLATTAGDLEQAISILERAWVRRDSFSVQAKVMITRALIPRDIAAAKRWFDRVEEGTDFATVKARTDLLVKMKREDDAAREWIEARARLALDQSDEMKAFDAWRRLAVSKSPPVAPDFWQKAASFWRKPAADLDPGWGESLRAHLAKYPYDRLSARNVLRSLAPARESWVAPVVAALEGSQDVASWRMARSAYPRSAKAAKALLPSLTVDVNSLRSRRFPRAEIEGLLSDLARIGAATGTDNLTSKALGDLESFKPAAAQALRPELASIKAKNAKTQMTFLERNGGTNLVRPRDLTWSMYSKVLNAENVP